ncbi:CRP-like cAMP-binding protein [Breoghania corrubedonensis]|uniref:CRP-like cAMP-binding protein n=1 Tax=Breoghania corrubedonensis TaxID=665038 RepID=A0A2T5VFD7_9HYPH|nr:CRP-like cAMP-binding protein [Breoghania corrubedonensis]
MKSVGQCGRSLRSFGIFEKLSKGALDRLSAACHWSAYDDGEEIVPYLDDHDDVYFLASGTARVMLYSRTGKAVAFRIIEAGDIFGELAAIDHAPRSARVEASSACVVARLPAEIFRMAMRDEPCVMEAVARHLVSQVRELTARVFAFSTLSVKTRIQSEILRLAGDPPDDAVRVLIPRFPTHGDLAVRVSTHREAVTREIGSLARQGVLSRAGRDLEIIDIARLRAMVEEGESGE